MFADNNHGCSVLANQQVQKVHSYFAAGGSYRTALLSTPKL